METFTNKKWAPVRYTKPLSEDFASSGPALIVELERDYKLLTGQDLVLYDYQKCLLNHVLERYPADHPLYAGQLRYRQVVISMGRQNGKTEIAAFLIYWGLFRHMKGAEVIGIAPGVKQANNLYKRLKNVVQSNTRLNKIAKATGTRGINFRKGTNTYNVIASGAEKLQGYPMTFGVADELHILDEGSWDSIVTGQRAQKSSMLIGITTAGDDNSKLLKRLYLQGDDAINGGNERFGFFLWEAPEGSTIQDHDAMRIANPAIMEGHIDVVTAIQDTLNEPIGNQERYGLNRFVAALTGWITTKEWNGLGHTNNYIQPGDKDIFFSIDKHGTLEYATITANKKDEDSVVHTEVVDTFKYPKLDFLLTRCGELLKDNPNSTIVIDGQVFKSLANMLKDKYPKRVKLMYANDLAQASVTFRALLVANRIKHDHHPVTSEQIPRGITKTFGDQWAVNRTLSIGDTDAMMSTVMGVYAAETSKKKNNTLLI